MLNVYTQKKIRAFEDFYVLDTDLLSLELEPDPEPDEVPEDIPFIVLVRGKEVYFYYYYYVFSKDGSNLYAKTKISDPYVEGETYKLQSYTTNTATYNRTDGAGMIKFYDITLEGGRATRYTLWGDTTKFVKLTHHEVIF